MIPGLSCCDMEENNQRVVTIEMDPDSVTDLNTKKNQRIQLNAEKLKNVLKGKSKINISSNVQLGQNK